MEVHPAEKMLFLAGPRQVGKTTLAQGVLESHAGGGLHLSWDVPAHRRRIPGGEDLLSAVRRPGRRPLLVLDEIHKMRRFKAWLKGLFDENRDEAAIWVTGSGRPDLHQKGGDSLRGRYLLYRMHPLSVGEVEGAQTVGNLQPPDLVWREFEAEPWFLAEAKLGETVVSPHLGRLASQLDCPRSVQIVRRPGVRLRVGQAGRIHHVVSAGPAHPSRTPCGGGEASLSQVTGAAARFTILATGSWLRAGGAGRLEVSSGVERGQRQCLTERMPASHRVGGGR